MHPDEYDNDLFFEDDEANLTYNDGFGETFPGEADQISGGKRREKDRRAAVRKDTGKVVGSARRHMERSARRERARNDAARLARLQWDRRFKPLLIKFWSPEAYGPLDAVMLTIMRNEVIRQAMDLAGEKVGDATSVEDVVSIGIRALLASAVAAASRRSGRMSQKQQEGLIRKWYDGLDAAEKAIKIFVGGGSGETEDWEAAYERLDDLETADEDDFAWENSPDNERVADGRRAARGSTNAGSPNERRLAAQVLRQSAKYLLRMERRLLEARR